MHTLQDEEDGVTGVEKLRDELLNVLKKIHKEKQEETLKVVVWSHLAHAYIKEVGEGEKYATLSISRFYSLNWISIKVILLK